MRFYMNLPNYFLVDLPPEATLTATMVTEACQTLKRNRERYLANRSTQSIIAVLCNVAKDWLTPDFEFRKLALDQGPKATGFSRQTLASGLDAFFNELTKENFEALIEQDLGNAQRLDQFVSTQLEQKSNRSAVANGPELIAHIAAGNLPCPTLMSIVLGMLVRSGQFVKCASGTSFFPRLFAHSIHQADSKLAACLEIAEWRGKNNTDSKLASNSSSKGPSQLITDTRKPLTVRVLNEELTNALFEHADCVTATGSDETLASIRRRLSTRTRFLGYGHQVSFGYVANGNLSGVNARKAAAQAADDVAAWDQLGCLSPHVIYVEHGGTVSAELFAEMLVRELQQREKTEPRGELPVEHAAAIASRRSFYETRAAYFHTNTMPDYPATRIWKSENSTAWTVIYEADPRFQTSCLNRFIYVKGVTDLTEMMQNADGVRGKVSTVGLAATKDEVQGLAIQLARWGVTRVCPLGRMQQPPLTWRHDGRLPLGELVKWTDYEME
jgi:Acyl-CoA reductase (LuxC).